MATAQTHRRISCREQTGKNLVAISQIAIIWIGERGAKPVLADRSYRHDPLWFSDGHGPEQHDVDQTEDGRVRPDAERKGEHGHGGEAGVLQQLADGEAKIAHWINGLLDSWIIGSMELDLINPFIHQSTNPVSFMSQCLHRINSRCT